MPLAGGGAHNLRSHEIDFVCRDEMASTPEGAKRQEIPVKSDVIESLQVFRIPRSHAIGFANGAPGPAQAGRYVPGPAKAGRYVRPLHKSG
jgi:hypothetical protein